MNVTIVKLNNSSISFNYLLSSNLAFNHTIEYSSSINPTDDSLFRIALLSRPENSRSITIKGIVVNEKLRDFFQNTLKSRIIVSTFANTNNIEKNINSLPEKSFLCFSGGFDSISAKALIGDFFDLVSVEFGEQFERESFFFKRFNTNVVKWDLRSNLKSIKFNESIDWRFLLSPALLFSSKNEPIAIATGTIMEASPYWVSGQERLPSNYYGHGGFGHSVALINPIACVTEFATTLIAEKYLDPKLLQLSLDSLAAPDSQKALRKKALLSIVSGTSLPSAPKKLNKYKFGTSFGDDMVALYIYWKCGKEWTLENYAYSFPEAVENLDMSFFEKYNYYNLNTIVEPLRSEIESKLKDYGIEKFNEKNYQEIEKVRSILLLK